MMNVAQLLSTSWDLDAPAHFLHQGGEHTPFAALLEAWTWEPTVLLGCAGLLIAYMWAQRFRLSGASVAFTAGVLVLLLALVSPLHFLGETYLFSVHMMQHLLLVLVVSPLLILGTPSSLFRKLLSLPFAARLERVLGTPYVAWLLAVGAMWLWHLPPLFNAALVSTPLHALEHGTFLATGLLFWWPVMTPVSAPGGHPKRMPALGSVLYLFLGGAANCVLGIILTFTPAGVYDYLSAADAHGILLMIRREWGLSAAADQQLGGMIMWVPGCLAYLAGAIAVLIQWYGGAEEEDLAPEQG